MKQYVAYIFLYICLFPVINIKAFSQTVQNPVIKDFVYHDSSLIDGEDGYFYSFVSCVFPRDKGNSKFYYTISIFRSKNLQDWEFYKYALSQKDIQQKSIGSYDHTNQLAGRYIFRDIKGEKHYYPLWAPDVIYYNHRYLLFFLLRKSADDTKITVFEANKLSEDFCFVNIIISNNAGDKSAYFPSREQIDPFPMIDGDEFYLVFGSFVNAPSGKILDSRKGMGVYMVKLDPRQNFRMKGKHSIMF